jgi:hypothetical protein
LSAKDLGDIAQTQREFLPLIFGKWDYFTASHQARSAREYLLIAAQNTTSEVERLEQCLTRPPSSSVEEHVHRHNIYSYLFLNTWTELGGQLAIEWLDMIRADKQILGMANREAQLLRNEAEANLDAVDEWLKALSGKVDPSSVVSPFFISGGFERALEFEYRTYATKELDRGNSPPTFGQFAKLLRWPSEHNTM